MSYSLDGLRTTLKEHLASAERNKRGGNLKMAKLDASYAKANLMKIYDIALELDQAYCDVLDGIPEITVDRSH